MNSSIVQKTGVPARKSTLLRQLLERADPVVAVGGHNALSAKLVEEAGFDAVWASGFEISAAHGVPDANILTMAENLAAAKSINDAVALPVIADCDNGYGNAINVIRMVEEYERAGIAAVCIEDNVFPKRCSFYAGVYRELVPIEEHAGKVRAAKETQRDQDFMVIARTEALIAGWGMHEALERAYAYAEAGADAILIHSKADTPDEVLAFAEAWRGPCPLVAVPTTYNTITAEELAGAGFRIVIFANHGLRGAIKGMRAVLQTLRRERRAAAVEEQIVPLNDVYSLIGVEGLKENENRFMRAGGREAKAIITAAGFEKSLLPLIEDRPKAMLEVKGRTILERQVASLGNLGIHRVAVVRGYKKEQINYPHLKYYDNDRFEETWILHSLFQAAPEMDGPFVALYGDILFEESIGKKLLQSDAAVSLVIDRSWPEVRKQRALTTRGPVELVITEPVARAERSVLPSVQTPIRRVGTRVPWEEAHAEFIGLALFNEEGARIARALYDQLSVSAAGKPFHDAPTFERASLSDFIQEMIDRGHRVVGVDIYKGWMEVDTFEDYQRAWTRTQQ